MQRIANRMGDESVAVKTYEARANRTEIKLTHAKETLADRKEQVTVDRAKVEQSKENADTAQAVLRSAEKRSQSEARKIAFAGGDASKTSGEMKNVKQDENDVDKDAEESAEALKKTRKAARGKEKAVRSEDRAKIRVARREFKLDNLKERVAEKKKRMDRFSSELKNEKEKVTKAKKTQNEAFAMAKQIQTGITADK